MITEDYVSLEIAKLLNVKGFKGEFHKHYWGYEPGKEFLTNSSFNPEYDYPAPTLQMAIKWLREVHKIHIVIYPYGDYSCDNYQFDVYKDNRLVVSKDDGYITYEEAAEAAIKYCLENLV